MILITGGAGFIGSNLQAALFARGYETIVVDRLRNEEKRYNLAKHPPALMLPPEALEDFLGTAPPVDLIFHLAGRAPTLDPDADVLLAAHLEQSKWLWQWCARHDRRFIYVSTAATYGDGRAGFSDGIAVADLEHLRPLSPYGQAKHAFDLYVAGQVAAGARLPRQWVGLKLFNVYGPNEYHKAQSTSLVKVIYDQIQVGQVPRLYRSNHPEIADGTYQRDFIFVDDVVAVMLWFLQRTSLSGLFNLGTGAARSYQSLALAVCRALGAEPRIDFVDIPQELHGKYVEFSQAEIRRLRSAGYTAPFVSLEDGVAQYINTFLGQVDPYR